MIGRKIPRLLLLLALACLVVACQSDDEWIPQPSAPAPASAPPDASTRSEIPEPSLPAATPVVSTPHDEDVAAVIEHLLTRIAESGLTFIRNGHEHTAAEAAAHIRRKYEHYRDEIETPEEFIDKAATKSELSGKPYLVKLPDGTTRRAADWLRDELAEYRDRAAGAG